MTSTWPNTIDVVLLDGPLAGRTITAPARVGPPAHLLIHPDGTDIRPGTNPPDDLTGWLLYADHGVDARTRQWRFTYRGPA